MILIGTAVIGGGGFYAVKEISKTNTIQVEQEKTENIVTNESATSSTSANKGVEEVAKMNTQTSVKSQSVNTPTNEIVVDTNSDVAVETQQANIPKQYALDQNTKAVCADANKEDNFNIHVKNIVTLCGEAQNNSFENEADFDDVIEEIHDEWDSWETTKKMTELEAELKEAQEQKNK